MLGPERRLSELDVETFQRNGLTLQPFLMANFAINGFGRIGRNVLRAMSQKQLERVLAINDLTDTHTLAHLLKWDSVHGKFDGEISYDDENIIVRGHKIRIIKDRDPANLPWKKLDIDVVLESTGFFTSRDKAELHLKAGAKRVLISAPAKNPDVTICIGVNDNAYDPAKDKIVSNASCTTNCFQRELHHELSRADGEGFARQIRNRAWIHEHHTQLHERPAHPRFSARRFETGASGSDQHHPFDDGRSQGNR